MKIRYLVAAFVEDLSAAGAASAETVVVDDHVAVRDSSVRATRPRHHHDLRRAQIRRPRQHAIRPSAPRRSRAGTTPDSRCSSSAIASSTPWSRAADIARARRAAHARLAIAPRPGKLPRSCGTLERPGERSLSLLNPPVPDPRASAHSSGASSTAAPRRSRWRRPRARTSGSTSSLPPMRASLNDAAPSCASSAASASPSSRCPTGKCCPTTSSRRIRTSSPSACARCSRCRSEKRLPDRRRRHAHAAPGAARLRAGARFRAHQGRPLRAADVSQPPGGGRLRQRRPGHESR